VWIRGQKFTENTVHYLVIKVKPFEEDLNIILSVPGIELISAATILAEMEITGIFSIYK